MLTKAALSPDYRRALGRGTLVVFMLFVFSKLVLDHGLTAQITLMAALGYLGRCRSHGHPSSADSDGDRPVATSLGLRPIVACCPDRGAGSVVVDGPTLTVK